ncbi:MAG: peptidoglycan-binding protein [Cyanobacteria bacterium P01_G01_bin.54]
MPTSFQLRRTGIVLGLLAGLTSGAIAPEPGQRAIAFGVAQNAMAAPLAQPLVTPAAPATIAQAETDAAGEALPAITRGMEGEVVEELQTLLQRVEVYDGEVTGSFDEATEQAVAQFQSQHELEPTGSLDIQTYDVLLEQVEKAAQAAAEKAEQEKQQRRQKFKKYLLVGAVGVVGFVILAGGTYFLFRFINRDPAIRDELYEKDDERDAETGDDAPEPPLIPDAVMGEGQPEPPLTPHPPLDPAQPSFVPGSSVLGAIAPDPVPTPASHSPAPPAPEPEDPATATTPPPALTRQPLQLSPIHALQPVAPPKLEAIAPLQDSPPPAADPPPAPTPTEPEPPPALQTPSSLQTDVWTESPAATPLNGKPGDPTVTQADTSSTAKVIRDVKGQPPAAAPTPTALTPQKTPLQKGAMQNGQVPPQSAALAVQPVPEPLPKADVVEELIRELRSPRPEERRQAIWELAQKGDSRAVQPLLNLLLDSDSQQQSLVLEALSQIGVRTLKPINRALALSLQDENAQVRKNAIRDVSRIYALLSQLSQLIYYATDDTDADVQETAQWALEQLKKIRTPHPGGS